MAVGVAHRAREQVVLDCVVERRPPFSPTEVVTEFVGLLHTYGISLLEGDRYASLWPREQFQQRGIMYRVAQHTKSDLYALMVPLVTSGRCELLDLPRLTAQLVDLERKVTSLGRETISHGPGVGARDDVANVCAGSLIAASGRRAHPAFEGYAEALAREELAWAAAHPAPAPGEWTVQDLQLGFGALAPKSPLRCLQCGRADDMATGWLLRWGGALCPPCQARGAAASQERPA
jgi:hypothetical protein